MPPAKCLFQIREDIMRTPTAYDVDAVVKELEEHTRTMMPVIPAKEAIEIVKTGGVE